MQYCSADNQTTRSYKMRSSRLAKKPRSKGETNCHHTIMPHLTNSYLKLTFTLFYRVSSLSDGLTVQGGKHSREILILPSKDGISFRVRRLVGSGRMAQPISSTGRGVFGRPHLLAGRRTPFARLPSFPNPEPAASLFFCPKPLKSFKGFLKGRLGSNLSEAPSAALLPLQILPLQVHVSRPMDLHQIQLVELGVVAPLVQETHLELDALAKSAQV